MRQSPQERRLAEAVAALAATIAEIISERLRETRPPEPQRVVAQGPDPFITVTEVMERVGVSRRTLYTWMQQGYVPYIRIGRSVGFDWKLVSERLKARFGQGPGLSL